MQITHVKIQNILGIEQLEFSPDGFNAITGRNGSGKTSVLEAIKATIRGGHDATLLRKGAKEGEVVLVLDDGTELRKRVTASNSTIDVKQGGKKVTKPQAAIQALTDMLSVNPVEFLTAPAKDRVRVLLESMPLHLDVDRLREVSGLDVQPRPGAHALHVIEDVRRQVYDARTGTNRAVTEKAATINQLRQALPPEGVGVDGDEASLQARLDEVNQELATEKTRIDTKLSGLRDKTAETIETLRAEAQAKIDAIKAQLDIDVQAQRDEFARIEGLAGRQREKAIAKHAAEAPPLMAKLQAIRNDRESYARRQQTMDTIATMETEHEALQAEAARQTAALDAIDAYKLELLGSLPIPGLEVRDGEVLRDGIPFDRLNTAQQVEIAVEIAKLRAGSLGVICVDRIESLDAAAFEAFRQRAIDSDLQLFVTRVCDDEFAIE